MIHESEYTFNTYSGRAKKVSTMWRLTDLVGGENFDD
jgi:hypothetical protein